MRAARSIVVVLCLLSGVVAQRRPRAVLLDFSDLTQRFTADAAQARNTVRPSDRFASIASLVLQGGVDLPAVVGQVGAGDADGNLLIARGKPDEMDLVKGMLEQLRQEPLPRARLQCSLLTMPSALGKLCLTAAFMPTDEIAFGRLVRDAVKQKGTLQNLPEVIIEPLVPFVVERAVKPGKPASAADQTLRLRGEMVPVRPGEVAFAMQLVSGPIPDDRTQMPRDVLLKGAFRLEAGKAVIAVRMAEERAIVVFVRCTEVTSGSPLPPQQKPGRWILP